MSGWTRRIMLGLPDRPRLEASPGFLLLLGVLYWLDEGVGLLAWGLLACAVHELGHVAAALALGGRAERLSLTIVGAELSFSFRTPLAYWQDSLVALAGPAANLLLGGLFFVLDRQLPAVLSLGIGAFNLLPILPLDGGQVLYGLLAEKLDPDWADRLLTAAAGCLVGLLAGAGVIAAVHYANVTLLLTAIWLLTSVLRRGGQGSGPDGKRPACREK